MNYTSTGKRRNRSPLHHRVPARRDPSRGNSHSNINALGANDRAEMTSEHPSLPKKPPIINVVLFGETGVGKSSVINLIVQEEIARVSSGVNGCTMQSTRYDISFDNTDFAIFETVGLEEPRMRVNEYLKAVEKVYELIVNLGVAGGVHLLLFCMRAGRATTTMQCNYRLFHECLCNKKVPTALVVTNLEHEVELEDWWKRNKAHMIYCGIKSNGHACITAVRGNTLGEEDLKYTESQRRVRELLKTCAQKDEALLLETPTWLANVGNLVRNLIRKRRVPGRENVMQVLTEQCKLDLGTARRIVEMMERKNVRIKDECRDCGPDEGMGEVGKEELGPAEGGYRCRKGRPAWETEGDDDKAKPEVPEENVYGTDDNLSGYHTATQEDDSEDELPTGGRERRKAKYKDRGDQSSTEKMTSEHPSPPKEPSPINVVLFGETGIGKSSVINVIAQQDVARVSSGVHGCTMQSTRYDISFDDMDFAIFETIGLEEPQMEANDYLNAVEKVYELIGVTGGIHLLLFCIRGGRITATTQCNYRLFRECLCSRKVPIALVFTSLEQEVEMEDWWERNETYIAHYGIRCDGHACITAARDDTLGEDVKYTESQGKIRNLLKTCALKSEAFSLEPLDWLVSVGNLMRNFIKEQGLPGGKKVMWVLTQRCGLDQNTARRIVERMEKTT